MKISKLLVLGALWFTASSAMAAIVNGVRQAPEPQTTEFAEGSQTDFYYLYNTSAKMFFTQGNTWGTRACVGPHASAVKMYFSASAAEDGSYFIQNYVCIRSTSYSWKGASAEGSGHALYCDQSNSWGRAYWNIVPVSGNVFRLQNITPYFAEGEETDETPRFMGRDEAVAQDFYNSYAGFEDDAERFPVSDNLAEGEGHHIDWALVAPADYEAIADAWVVFAKAQELKAIIDEAKEKNIDVAAEEAIYLNEAATIEELEAAIAAVKEKINHAAENTATPENPANMTASIANASYDNGTKNWSGTAPAIGYTAGEFYEKNFNMYQDLENIPNGVYAVKLKGYFRPGSTVDSYAKWAKGEDLNSKLYAKAGEDSLTVALVNIFEGSTNEKLGIGTEYGENGTADEGQEHYVPNNMEAGEAYFNAGRYQNVLYVGTDNGALRIGLAKNDANFGMNWTMFDQWELSYLGNSAEAFKFWVDEAKKNVPDFSNLGGTIYTESYLTALNEVVAAATASTKVEAVAAMNAIDAAVADLQKNIALWKDVLALIDEAKAVGADDTLDPDYTGDLAEWAEFDSEDVIKKHDLTNEELEALIAEKKAEIEEARKHPFVPGSDMTKLLTNPNFQLGEEGWTGFRTQSSPLMPVIGGPNDNRCAEAWNTASFDLYQVVENAPQGVYEISVQGFYRYGRGDNAWNHYNNQDVDEVKPGGAPCFVYMNAKATPFQNVFDEKVAVEDNFYSTQTYTDPNGEFMYPDGMVSAGEAYSREMYTQRAFGLVAKKGDVMRVGVKGSSNQLGDSWCIFDNFKLTWWGFDKTEYIQPVLQEELAKAKARLAETMGKTAYEHLSAAIAAAEAADAGTDGKTMFDALSDLFDVDAEVTASVAAFKELDTYVNTLASEIEINSGSAAIEEAAALLDEIMNNKDNHVYEDADIADLIAKIKEMIIKLRIPTGDPTDAAPVDYTNVITNASYDENLDGWNCVASRITDDNEVAVNPSRNSEAGNVELFNCKYDYYQELSGLPEGIYRVQVTGFYRAGNGAEDFARLDSTEYSRAFIYAIGEEGKRSTKALHRLSEYTIDSYGEETGYAVAKIDTIKVPGDEEEMYNYTLVANNMTVAGDLFAQGEYGGDAVTGEGNVVTVKVGADGKLRFGLMKDVLLDNDWTIWDDWKLWFFGPNSALTPDEDTRIADISFNKAVRVEYFTVDGRKATAAQRGIIIQRMTMPDGTVIVNKIRK